MIIVVGIGQRHIGLPKTLGDRIHTGMLQERFTQCNTMQEVLISCAFSYDSSAVTVDTKRGTVQFLRVVPENKVSQSQISSPQDIPQREDLHNLRPTSQFYFHRTNC